jgi:hypothetical protein
MDMSFMVVPLALFVWRLAYGPAPRDEPSPARHSDVAELLSIEPARDLPG